jgi:HlyD family secretion protein
MMSPHSPPANNWIIGAFTVALALGVAGCAKKAVHETPRAQARTVSVVTVEPREIEGGLTASGSLVPREQIEIYPQLTGYVVSQVLVDVGSWVKAGQPLARLDDDLLRAQVAQQNALAAQQTVLAAQAQDQAARVKGLDQDGLLSQEQIDQRRFQAKAALAQSQAQDAAAQDMRTREALTVVRTPFAGLVTERNVRFGDLTGGTTPLFRIAKDGVIELAADVEAETLDKIHPGDKAQVTLSDGQSVVGVVRLVSPAIDATTKLGRVRITLPVRPDARSGGFARATFLGYTRSATAVPETAVRYDAEGVSVMAVDAQHRVQRIPVTTGQRGGGYVELVSGPPVGTQVVERAAAMLVPGDYVNPVPAY